MMRGSLMMSRLHVALSFGVLAIVVGAVGAILLPASPAAGQESTVGVPQTQFGKPDLNGVWDFSTITPLERPAELADTAVLTTEQVAQLEQEAAQDLGLDRGLDQPLQAGGDVGGYNQFWADQGTTVVEGGRTSLIVDPPNGRLPAYQPGVKNLNGSHYYDPTDANQVMVESPVPLRTVGIDPPQGPEDRGLAERCILGFNTGPPLMPGLYNNHIQLFHTEDVVVIYNEMVHEARIVPLDDRPPLPTTIQQWMGSSLGRWEGDTLVVESRNFSEKSASFTYNSGAFGVGAAADQLHVVERFTRVDEDTLRYEFTVDDPTVFTRAFSGEMSMKRLVDEPLFEYACHEGNYGLENILRGARVKEELAAASERR